MRSKIIIIVGLLSVVSQSTYGAHIATWTPSLDNPGRMAISASQVLVTEPRSGRIVRFDLNGTLLGEWAEPLRPEGIAIHPDGRIFVSRGADATVGVYDANFDFLHLLSGGSFSFIKPTDLAIDDTTGRIYLVDSGANRIYVFETDESLAMIVGIRGDRFGEFKYPSAVAIDSANDRLYIADQDNFRIQAFTRTGIFLFSFGYRIKYLPGGVSEGWMPRTTGLSVDSQGTIYVVDALMGTLRAFDPSGAELALLASHGVNPGDLQVPAHVAADGNGRLFVANSNAGSVELYDGYTAAQGVTAGIVYRGTNFSTHDDLWQWMTKDRTLSAARSRDGTSKSLSKEILNATSTPPGWDAPHMLDDLSCGRCHGIVSQPLGHEGTVDGQANLCQSCHSAGGQASVSSIRQADRVDAGGATPSGSGRSHAWGVSAVNAIVGSVGPATGSELDLHLHNGTIKCATCHNQHNNDADAPLLRADNTDGALCKQCHADHIGHTPGGAWQPTCKDCHDMHAPMSGNLALIGTSIHNQTLNVDKPILFTATTGAGSFADGDPSVYDGICESCHTTTAYHRQDGSGAQHNEGLRCTTCHLHSAGFLPVGGSCIACHSSPQDNGDNVPPGGRAPVVNADGSGGHDFGGGVLTDSDCLTCHDMSAHQQGNVRLKNPADPNNPLAAIVLLGDPSTDTAEAAKVTALCEDCHTSEVIHTPNSPWQPECVECHSVHDPSSMNIFLVAKSIRNQTTGLDAGVVFTSQTGPNSFNDGDPAAQDGVCQVCHTSTNYHVNDGSGALHNEGQDCTSCHGHDAGFLPSTGDCTLCHNAPQDNGDGIPVGGRRAVISEFGLSSHHLQGASLDIADCVVCHDMSAHQQGQVRLKNVDDPTNPAVVIVLAQQPSMAVDEAIKLEAFCLACHDADGAAGLAPFTDGIMPSPIDNLQWVSASHRLGGANGRMTCFGDGETFGCHNTGHGSAKRKLLAPANATQPPVAGDPLREEEGMCYTCHDADGPAMTDVQGKFALMTHHNVNALEQVDGSRVECTDCHNPHTASAALPLANPDSGGVTAWSGSGEGFCLTCHDGSPPAGISFPMTMASGSGYDKSSYAGTAHEFVLGPDSCQGCHDDHGSANSSLLAGQYVTTDYHGASTGDGSYAACWNCHDETATIVGGNAFKKLHDKHVIGENAPCYVCHQVHGGTDPGESGLINFEISIQQGYDIQYIDGRDASTAFTIDAGTNKGSCYIQCHGKDHKPKDYDRIDVSTVSCNACHGVVQNNGDSIPIDGRRAVLGEFPVSSTHAHYGATLDEADCLVCHDMATHQDGFVELIDPDAGSIYRFIAASDLTGDPDVSNFCDGCHDADGATRLAQPFNPFGNGNAAPDVATKFSGALQWNETYGDFCFGNEGTLRGVNSHHDISDADQAFSGAKLECINCHSSHGVSNAQPTADPFNPTKPWTGSDNDFCITCHGGGNGPLDPQFPPDVFGPVIDVNDPGWVALGLDWTTILGGACLTADCSSLRGIDSCDYVDGPWYVDYSWTHSAHGPDSKRAWGGYSGAPGADMNCKECHDPHGSYTPTNTLGNPYMIRDTVDGTPFIDDGTRTGGFNGPPWNTSGTARGVTVGISGLNVDWGSTASLCSACHADWLNAYDFHSTCNGCQTCHGHGMAFGEADFVGANDTPCPATPAPSIGGAGITSMLIAQNLQYNSIEELKPILHQAQLRNLPTNSSRSDSPAMPQKE